jgi:argininosuccinate lyase
MTNNTWGGRFTKPLDPKVTTFNASLPFDYVLYEFDIQGSMAHATMLGKQGLLSTKEATLICQALREIKHEIQQNQHPLDENCEDIHMFIEHLLIQKIGSAGKKLHTGRSRNDQVALDLRLYARAAHTELSDLLKNLIATFKYLMQQHKTVVMPGYTHLQQAQPIRLSHYFGAYAAMFERDDSRLQDSHKRLNYSPLGAGALAGSRLPLDRQSVADELGFTGIIENTLDAVSDRDYLIEFCGIASIIMMHLSRLCEDLILWSTQEFNYLTLDDAFATGSSLMPNKKNPDVLELIRGKSGRVFGHLTAILTVMKGLPLAYNKDMQEDKECLFDTVNTLKACLSIITPFLQSVSFNIDIMEQRANSGFLNATHVLESLVLQGVPFRDAHHQVGIWIREALEKGCNLSDYLEGNGHV